LKQAGPYKFASVILPVHIQHDVMPARNLLYTDVTRGKRCVLTHRLGQGGQTQRREQQEQKKIHKVNPSAFSEAAWTGREFKVTMQTFS
jgi:hypothetical protein